MNFRDHHLMARAQAILRSFLNRSGLFALAMISSLWVGVIYLEKVEYGGAEKAALRTSENLARAFAQQFSAGLEEADRILIAMRESYAGHPEGFEFKPWMPSNSSADSPLLLLGIIGPNGFLKSTNATVGNGPQVDLSGADQFKVHVNNYIDQPFISRSTTGRTTGKPTILLTRRIMNTDGTFGGVATASLNPDFFTRLYSSVDIGSNGFINITGSDGIVRITDKPNSKRVGLDLSKSDLFENYRLRSAGIFYTESSSSDGIPRIVTYRPVGNYPLLISIGVSKDEIFSSVWLHARIYNSAGAVISAAILMFFGFQSRNSAALTRMAEELRLSNGRFQAALSNMSQGLCMFDAKQRLIICNKAYAELYGLDEKQTAPGTTLREILQYRVSGANSPDDSVRYINDRIAEVEANEPYDTINQLRDGRYIVLTHRPTEDGGWVATHEDVTSKRIAEVKIEHMARHDALTGLENRLTLMEKIEDAGARFRRRSETFSLLMLDLDQFKQVNDTLGHAAGDSLLCDVASRLKSCLRETDGLARLGGDEFAIIQAGETNCREASTKLAERIVANLAEPFNLRGNEVYIGVSVGIALAPEPEHSTVADELLKMADIALYSAKASGRNCYRVFGTEMIEAMSKRNELERDLLHAIENDELILHYQPIIDAKTRRMCGAEALIRWQHPTMGMIAPDQFIPLAEDTGLIVPIGEWVLHTACREAIKWPAEIKIAVNLSAKQFNDNNLADVVMYVLSETGLPPERLELEITETALIGSVVNILPVLRQFKNLGISVALDDFGTGYSSLSQLTMFPFDKIKIDRSFTQNMTKRADCAAIIAATMTLAHGLDKETTAEGVETQEQYKLLRLAGVTSLQGYLFKRPGPAAELDFEGVYGNLELENAA